MEATKQRGQGRGDYALSKDTTAVEPVSTSEHWIEPLELAVCEGVQSYLRELLELEVTRTLGRLRYGRQAVRKVTATGTARVSG